MNLDDFDEFCQVVDTQKTLVSKDALLSGLARGRSVLDLGCIDHSASTARSLRERWLHRQLREVTAELVGIDVLESDAAELNAEGYDIRCADAEDFDLGRTFEVIVAGDLIEHLSNPGRLLESAARHMDDDSVFVVTTPNPFNIEQVVGSLLRRQVWVNDEHTLWLDPRVAHHLVSRSPLRVVDFHWIDTRFHFSTKGGRIVPRLANAFSRWAMSRRPNLRRDFALVLERR